MRSWLKEERAKKGLTQKQMAAALNISESYYCTIETGERQKKMDLTVVAGLSSVLGIPIAEIAELESQPEPAE